MATDKSRTRLIRSDAARDALRLGAEAVFTLRPIRSNGDLAAYWRYHLAQERQRVHSSRYADGIVPWPHDVPPGESKP